MNAMQRLGEETRSGAWLSVLRRVPTWAQIKSFDRLVEICPAIASVHLFTDRELELEFESAVFCSMTLISTRNSASVMYLDEAPQTFMAIPLAGSLVHTTNYRRLTATPGRTAVISAFKPSRLQPSHGFRGVYVLVDSDALKDWIGEPFAMEDLDGVYPLADPRIAAWADFAVRMGAELEASGALSAERERALACEFRRLFLAGPLAMRREARGRGTPSQLRTVRAAVDFMGAHLAERITLADLKRACGVSERTIQSSFQRYFDLTPWAYLRMRRLDQARHLLADPGCKLGVTEIAAACGFSHFSQFSVDYRDFFGESPKRTSLIFRSSWNRWRATLQLAAEPTAVIKKHLDRFLGAGA